MRLGVSDHLVELVDNVIRSGLVGITHAQIDDVHSPAPQLHLVGVDFGENIGGQTFDPS